MPPTDRKVSTGADHAAESHALLDKAAASVCHQTGHEAETINALCGIGYALLALHEDAEARRAWGAGW